MRLLFAFFLFVVSACFSPEAFALSPPDEAEVQGDITYDVDTLLNSRLPEGAEVSVTGRLEGRDLEVSEDYEGPGSGMYLLGAAKKILVEFEPEKHLELYPPDVVVVMHGFVGYCGGKKDAKYICKLTLAEVFGTGEGSKHIFQ